MRELGDEQRFRRMKSLQKFVFVHASIPSHFSQNRHLVDRQTCKIRRSVALVEWQSLASQAANAKDLASPGGDDFALD